MGEMLSKKAASTESRIAPVPRKTAVVTRLPLKQLRMIAESRTEPQKKKGAIRNAQRTSGEVVAPTIAMVKRSSTALLQAKA